ncbi:uncharacterized protein [Miscanthus floridulus]|uniref:uncharacterized protein n=1 Tax=Miscanthus floridulus TaxID=154761 RepID=UPI0034576773
MSVTTREMPAGWLDYTSRTMASVNRLLSWVAIMSMFMTEVVPKQELYEIVKQMRNNANPGPDGLTAAFYKLAWSWIKQDVSKLWLSGRVFARRRRLGAELLQFSHRRRHRQSGAAGPQVQSVEGQAEVVAPSTRANPSPSALISRGHPRVSRRATAFSSATPSRRGRWGRLRRSWWADGRVAKGGGFRGARRSEGSSTLRWLKVPRTALGGSRHRRPDLRRRAASGGGGPFVELRGAAAGRFRRSSLCGRLPGPGGARRWRAGEVARQLLDVLRPRYCSNHRP